MRIEHPKLILVDGAAPYELNAIDVLIGAKAKAWWHHIPNVWLIDSADSSAWWRDTIKKLVLEEGSTVLVLALGESGREWAYNGPSKEGQISWLHDHYSGRIEDEDIPF